MDGEDRSHQVKHSEAMDDAQSKVSKDNSRSKESLTLKSNHGKDEERSGQTMSKPSRKSTTTKAKSGRARRRDRHGKKNDDSGFKLVLRLLPPDLTEEQFVDTLKPVVGDFKKNGIVGWYYVQGHYSVKFRSEPVYSRCYFSFNAMEHLEKFTKLVQPIKFVDDEDNVANAVTKISAYNKRPITSSSKSVQSKQSLEGTIDADALFQTFMKSLHTLEERKSDFSYADISILRSLEKELAKKKAVESEIQKKTELAIVALTGDNEKKTKGKSKKKNKKKDRAAKEEVNNNTAEATAGTGTARKRKKSKKKAKTNSDSKAKNVEKNNNVVILEAAGRKELQRRKKLQMEKERLSENVTSVKNKGKPRSKGKSSDPSELSKDDVQDQSKVKILKRELSEHT